MDRFAILNAPLIGEISYHDFNSLLDSFPMHVFSDLASALEYDLKHASVCIVYSFFDDKYYVVDMEDFK